jgi:putative MFS transporter
MSTTKSTTFDSGDTSEAFKRRFLIRLVIVLIGGMFLDGYILGIVGQSRRRSPMSCRSRLCTKA